MAKSVYPLPGDQMEERLRRSEMEERDQRGRVEDNGGGAFQKISQREGLQCMAMAA